VDRHLQTLADLSLVIRACPAVEHYVRKWCVWVN
jgi:hypothetical protein